MQYTHKPSTRYADDQTDSVLKPFFSLLLLLVMLALAGCANAQIPSPTPTTTAAGGTATQNPSPTATSVPVTGTGSVEATATSYYQAIQAQDYTRAYSFLDVNIVPLDGQKLTQQAFVQVAQFRDTQYGPVSSFSALVSTTDPTAVVMTVSRKGGLRYHTHLKFKQEGNGWKILTLDGI
jgi:hypothetical protein